MTKKVDERDEAMAEESERVHEQLLSRFRMGMLQKLGDRKGKSWSVKKAPLGKYLVECVSMVQGDVMMGNEYREVICESLDEVREKVAKIKDIGLERAVILDDQGKIVE